MFRIRAAFLTSAVAGLLLVAPGLAQATDRFVDDDSGTDVANDCTVAANPCQTVANAVAQANASDLTLVDGGTYVETVTLDMGKSLRELEINGADMDSQAIIDGGAANAITVLAGGAGTISDFTLRSTGTAVSLLGAAQLTSNLLDSGTNGSIGVSVAGDDAIIAGNQFTDDMNAIEQRTGVVVGDGDVTITGNSFSSLSDPLLLGASGDDADVIQNEITGTHQWMANPGRAINVVSGANPTLVANRIHSPNIGGTTIGVSADSTASVTMRRNRVFTHNFGLEVTNSPAFSMSNDVIKDSSILGLVALDLGLGGGDVTATNATFTGNATDVFLSDTLLTLNSSIVEDPIVANGTATCLIDFSRGPSPAMGGNGCADFDTDAPPTFTFDGYHLSPFSPLVDLGDPAAPLAPDDVDVDGNPRSLDENCDGIARRNMGADEIPRSCFGPSPLADPAPTATSPKRAKKKCKKKGKKGAAAAKKCKRKKRK